MALTIGTQLGSHEIIGLLGKGGMGERSSSNVSRCTKAERRWWARSPPAISLPTTSYRGRGRGMKERNEQKPHGLHSKPFFGAPRCGARNRKGTPCQLPAMHGRRRCALHGGKSTGPRTMEGVERIRKARTKHGRYSAKAKAEQRAYRALLRECRAQLAALAELGLK